MNIERLLERREIRKKTAEPAVIKSLIETIEMTASGTLDIECTPKTAIIIFRELYECLRQLGDILWWMEGYEPQTHDISIAILKEQPVKEKQILQHLDRYKNIRHDINYRAFRSTKEQAEEIISFWNSVGKEILALIKEKSNRSI